MIYKLIKTKSSPDKRILDQRREVYILEFGYEECESDLYDLWSFHYGLVDESDGHDPKIAGSVRMIISNEHGFPYEKIPNISYSIPSHVVEKRGVSSEISRLIVSSENRKMRTVLYELFKVIYQESKIQGISVWFMVAKPKLMKTLKRVGINFKAVSDTFFFRGERCIYYASVEIIEQDMLNKNPKMSDYFLNDLPKMFHPEKSTREMQE